MFRRALAPLTVAVVLGLGAAARADVLASPFDHGLDGWTLTGGAAPATPAPQSAGGHPGGFAQAVDAGTGGELYWNAPPPYVADGPLSFGGAIGFDRISTVPAVQPSGGDFVLVARDTTTLRWTDDPLNARPGLAWTRTTVWLLPSLQWTDRTGAPATEVQLRHVLGTLAGMQIAARYASGPATDGLDNVLLAYTPPPLPAAARAIVLRPECGRSRSLTLRLHAVHTVPFVSAALFVDRRRVRIVRGPQLRGALHLRGLPRRSFAVRIVVTTSDGRTIARRRSYRGC